MRTNEDTDDEDEFPADRAPSTTDSSESHTPDFADDAEITREVPIERENTLKRIRQDYDEPWKGVIREATQNSGDAWGRNMQDGVLPDDVELEIEFVVDPNQKTFTYRDNAGGMDRETLEENLIGIDTPDEDKDAGEGAGAYGRGFYVISMCGKGKTYVETRHGDEHLSSTVTNYGRYQEPQEPSRPQLGEGVDGTYIHVTEVIDHDMEKLTDWEAVEQVLIENFTFLLLRDQVTVEYIIDGEPHTASPPDMAKYKEEGELIYKEKLPTFSAEGGEYQVRDLTVIRTDVMEEDPPWDGVAMLKGNKYLEAPFMTVKVYKPTGIPSLRQSPEMIGWCDASDLCPELENNAHTSFRGHETKTGIKDVLMELHQEHFKKGRSTEERKQLANDITRSINELLLEYDDFDNYRVSEGEFTDETAGEDDDDGPGTKGKTSTSGNSLLKVQAGKRKFDVGETVPLKAQVQNPEGAEHERYEIYDITVGATDLGLEHSLPSWVVEVPENEHTTFDIQSFQPTEEGVYTFSARIRPQPEVLTLDDEYEEADRSRITFYVGVKPPSQSSDIDEPSEDDGGGGDEESNAAIVRDTSFYTADTESWKAVVSSDPDGGLDVTINANRPEWLSANRITDDDDLRDKIQHRLGTTWGVEEAVLHRNIDELHEVLGDITVDGENAAELLEDRLKDRAGKFAEMEAKIVDQYGLDYQS